MPSANAVLVRGERPILVDPGFGADLPALEGWLRAAGVPPERLALVVNTHYHCDHVGGNHGLQARSGLPVAAHVWDAALINARDPDACLADWLDHPVEPYRVDLALADGDTIDAGGAVLQVLHTPGHTLGHTALYAREAGLLICGDAVQGDDVAWLNPLREGGGALHRAMLALDRLAGLGARLAWAGHGPPIHDPAATFDAARRRYERWLREPERAAWHGCKRIFVYALMLRGGLPAEAVASYLLGCPWFGDFSRHIFRVEPTDFVRPLVDELLRAGAAGYREGRLVPLVPYVQPPAHWASAPPRPRDWPRAGSAAPLTPSLGEPAGMGAGGPVPGR